MYFRFELFFLPKNKEVFKKIPAFLGQSKNSRRVDMARDSKKCLDIVGADAKMKEYEGLASVHGYTQEMLDDIFDFLRDKLRAKPRQAEISKAETPEAKNEGS